MYNQIINNHYNTDEWYYELTTRMVHIDGHERKMANRFKGVSLEQLLSLLNWRSLLSPTVAKDEKKLSMRGTRAG